jgi:predicted DCC family thiol-disulfide oxidoreductase YuxK
MGRTWSPRAISDVAEGLIVFDGVCVLCSRWVRFVIERDVRKRFRFTPIQGKYGRALAERLGIDPENPETNAVIIGDRAYFKSDSAIEVLGRLPGWSWVRMIGVAPRFVRDWAYDRIARNRYRLFGKLDSCLIPTADIVSRFIADDPHADRRHRHPRVTRPDLW